jgi:hypothetical protein
MYCIQVNKARVLFEGASDCKEFLIADTMVIEKARSQAFQTTISASPISENGIVNITTIKDSRSLIPSKNLSQCDSRSTFHSAAF